MPLQPGQVAHEAAVPGPGRRCLGGPCGGCPGLSDLACLGLEALGWPAVALGVLGAVGGYAVGTLVPSPAGRMARAAARRGVGAAAALGGVYFAGGFAAP